MSVKIVRRTDISLSPGAEDADLQEGAVDVLRLFMNTANVSKVNKMVYERTRVVQEMYPQCWALVVMYR